MIASWDIALKKMLLLAESRGFKADFARRLGVESSSIQCYFDGTRRPGLDLVDRFASALGIQPWELIKPSNAWPTTPKKLTAIEHLQEVIFILRTLENAGVSLNPDFVIKNLKSSDKKEDKT